MVNHKLVKKIEIKSEVDSLKTENKLLMSILTTLLQTYKK